jgi:hypoxanthine phosphoribosyltransferase
MGEAMAAFAKCFRKKFFPDLVVRHTTATKSATTRAAGGSVDHDNQLNTIRVNKAIQKGKGEVYKSFPIARGKTVLLVDDFCTRGYSLEAGRLFLAQTGASVICMSWLKTINSDYTRLVGVPNFDPYTPRTFAIKDANLRTYPYRDFISDPYAPEEIDNKLRAYDTWKWPSGI